MTERGTRRGSVDDAMTEGQILRLFRYWNHIEKKAKGRADMGSIIIIIIIILAVDMIIELTTRIMHTHRIFPFPLTIRLSGGPHQCRIRMRHASKQTAVDRSRMGPCCIRNGPRPEKVTGAVSSLFLYPITRTTRPGRIFC